MSDTDVASRRNTRAAGEVHRPVRLPLRYPAIHGTAVKNENDLDVSGGRLLELFLKDGAQPLALSAPVTRDYHYAERSRAGAVAHVSAPSRSSSRVTSGLATYVWPIRPACPPASAHPGVSSM